MARVLAHPPSLTPSLDYYYSTVCPQASHPQCHGDHDSGDGSGGGGGGGGDVVMVGILLMMWLLLKI